LGVSWNSAGSDAGLDFIPEKSIFTGGGAVLQVGQ